MAAPTYFVDHKRGEVNELKALLRNQRVEKDPVKKREVIKKVIAYMTLGIDVSKIFSEMVLAAATKDPVQKKMVYLYLCSYAQQKATLALMAINTLQKDCADEDPMVRGLALRSLCSLRLPNVIEYAMLPMRRALNDPSPYVRKTAVLGSAKLYRLFAKHIKDSDLVDLLYQMLKDKDTGVISNVICALNEILASEGGMAINTSIIMYLLNKLKEFNEWGQCIVLELVARYVPTTPTEMFDIMNLLEERLKHSNSAVVMGTTKVFLNLTKGVPRLHEEVYRRLKAPLLTLMAGGSVELSFAVLGHISILVQRAPGVFNDAFKHFFCRFNEPACVKKLKLQILTALANDRNMSEIIAELAEYVTDVDADIARSSIKGIGRIAIKIDLAADEAVEHLLSFLDLNNDYVTAETCIVLKDLLRKYPERYEEVIPALQKCLKSIDETEGKVAVIWMIGEYGETIADAPYILEPLIDAFGDEPSHQVRMELLTAAMKLFFKRPPEMKRMLGRLLAAAIADVGKVDVRDRALMYYRLLSLDVLEAARVVNCPKVIVDVFAETVDPELKEKIFAEFNSLSVTYGMPSERFVDEKANKDPELVMADGFDRAEDPEREEGKEVLLDDRARTEAGTVGDEGKEAKTPTAAGGAGAAAAAAGAGAGAGAGARAAGAGAAATPPPATRDLLSGLGEFAGEFEPPAPASPPPRAAAPPPPSPAPTPAPAKSSPPPTPSSVASFDPLAELLGAGPPTPAPAPVAATPPFSLVPCKLDPPFFQARWGALPVASTLELALKMSACPSNADKSLENLIKALTASRNVITLASGSPAGAIKFYFYARDAATNALFLIETLVNIGAGKLNATLKAENAALAPQFFEHFRSSIAQIL